MPLDNISSMPAIMSAAGRVSWLAPHLSNQPLQNSEHISGLSRTEFLQRCKLLVDVGSCTEVHGPYQVVESVLGEVGRPVALEQCYAGVVGAYDVADLRYVAFVFP